MTTEQIRKSVSEMSDEELDEVIRGQRSLRREGGRTQKAARSATSAAKTKKGKDATMLSLFSSLSPEEQQALLAKLKGE